MIAFGCAITEPEHYKLYAEAGIRLAAEPDSTVLAQGAPFSKAPIYNLILDQAASSADLEALVLIHEKAEILDAGFCQKVRQALADPEVAVIGCAGGAGVRGIAWWDGKAAWASSVYRSEELGCELPGLLHVAWNATEHGADRGPGEVDAVDGVIMALSPWAVRNIRFDESLGPRYGYDFDFCLQARAAGRKVVTEDLKVAHYYPLAVVDEPETWIEAHMRAAEKWDDRMPDGAAAKTDWKPRARRAEAEAATALLLSASKMYEAQALAWAQQREFREATDNLSWRMTAPLRRLNALRRATRRRGSALGR